MDPNKLREDVEATIRRHTRHPNAAESLEACASLNADLNMNSADLVDIVLDLEEQFAIYISDDQVNALQTVGDVLSLVDSLFNGKSVMAAQL